MGNNRSDAFNFSNKHFGPHSQELVTATEVATLSDNLTETQRTTQCGGTYSIFSTRVPSKSVKGSPREKMVRIANEADPIELELAVTAAFLASEGIESAWQETVPRKPDKVGNGRLEGAKALYKKFLQVQPPTPLPVN